MMMKKTRSLKLGTLAVALAGFLLVLPGSTGQAAEVGLGNEGRSPIQASARRGDQAPSDRGGAGEGGPPSEPARYPADLRSADGTGNNLLNPEWGSAGSLLLRLTSVDYADGQGEPAGADRESARVISNACAAQTELLPNRAGLADLFWQWGQFLDHDLSLTPVVSPIEPFDVPVTAGDAWFDPDETGSVSIPLDRSSYELVEGIRQQVNAITAWIDASQVYGSDTTRSQALRTLDGSGRLKTSAGDLLPFNLEGLPNAPVSTADYFLAGDFRANEQVGLIAMHTLFVREHNLQADRIRLAEPNLDGDATFERARAMVVAEMQAITYGEFLPLLLGSLQPYRGYRSQLDAGISNEFATAAYRFGHSMLSPWLLRLDEHGQPIAAGHLSLADAFFNPDAVVEQGIEPVLRGLVTQRAQAIDPKLVDEVRNFLFGAPGSGGFDLASLNIQRGRDHGLPSYNRVRTELGLRPFVEFSQISRNPATHAALESVYLSVDDVDAWVGMLAERPGRSAVLGQTALLVLREQFTRLRDGDRFWYQSYLPPHLVQEVERRTLATLLAEHARIRLQGNPFLVGPR